MAQERKQQNVAFKRSVFPPPLAEEYGKYLKRGLISEVTVKYTELGVQVTVKSLLNAQGVMIEAAQAVDVSFAEFKRRNALHAIPTQEAKDAAYLQRYVTRIGALPEAAIAAENDHARVIAIEGVLTPANRRIMRLSNRAFREQQAPAPVPAAANAAANAQ